MDKLDVNDIIKATKAQLLHGCASTVFTGISTDSRQLQKGDLFVALCGDQFNGHTFISQAIEKGAAGLLLSQDDDYKNEICEDTAVLKVKDTLKALQDIGAYYRLQFDIPVIGVTGSNGKTTTKDMIAAILAQRYPVHKTSGNFNNEIGVPLTLLGIERYHCGAIVEMGMRGLGQIMRLCEIAHPTMGVVTNVGVTHIGELGSQKNIAAAKGELIEALDANGVAVLNGDDPFVRELASHNLGKVLFFGFSSEVDIQANTICSLSDESCEFLLRINEEEMNVVLPVPGKHNVYNALAAAGVASALGFSLGEIKDGLKNLKLTGMRCEFIDFPQFRVINDAYNASPTSMEAALKMLCGVSAKRRIAVLGDMLELGNQSDVLHTQVGIQAGKCDIDCLICIGQEARNIGEGACQWGMMENIYYCATNQEAGELLLTLVQPGDMVLLKASRGMKLEEIIDHLKNNIS